MGWVTERGWLVCRNVVATSAMPSATISAEAMSALVFILLHMDAIAE